MTQHNNLYNLMIKFTPGNIHGLKLLKHLVGSLNKDLKALASNLFHSY